MGDVIILERSDTLLKRNDCEKKKIGLPWDGTLEGAERIQWWLNQYGISISWLSIGETSGRLRIPDDEGVEWVLPGQYVVYDARTHNLFVRGRVSP